MIGIETLVYTVLFLLGCALIIAILWSLINYLQKEIGGPEIIYKGARIAIYVGTCLLLICVILDWLGHPVIVWRK